VPVLESTLEERVKSPDHSVIRVGFLGLGQASQPVVRAFRSNAHFEIVAGADGRAPARAQFETETSAASCSDFDQLYDRFDLDAVYVGTPTKMHEDHVVAALEAGLHVLVEKPIAATTESARTMIEVARKARRVLLVCHKRSADRPILSMGQVIASGELGRVRAVHRWHFSDWYYRPRRPGERDASGGGVVLRQGAHEFDILSYLAGGSARRVRGWIGDYDQEMPGEGAYQAWVEFDNGVLGDSVFSGYDHFRSDELTFGVDDASLTGRTARAHRRGAISPEAEAAMKDVFRFAPNDEKVFGFTLVNCEHGDLRSSPAGGALVYSREGRREVRAEGVAGTRAIVEEFRRAVSSEERPLRDGAWGLRVLELCLAVRESAKDDAVVDLALRG
jgi:phthalate 4,5-cis-dihydrodiol dehydrogenase